MIGRVSDYQVNQSGEIVRVYVLVEEFEIILVLIGGELKCTGFMNYAHGRHHPTQIHTYEAKRVARGFISNMKKRQEAADRQPHFDF